jgi:hypothetical protein
MKKLYAWVTAVSRIVTSQGKSETQFLKVPKSINKFIPMISKWYQGVLQEWSSTNIVHIAATGKPKRLINLFTDANAGKKGDLFTHGGMGWYSTDLELAGSLPFTKDILKMAFRDKSTSSTWLEWLALSVAVVTLKEAGHLEGALLTAHADSEPMCIGFENGSAASHLYPFMLVVVQACIVCSARIRLVWISRDCNVISDALGRGSRPPQLPARIKILTHRANLNKVLTTYKNLCQVPKPGQC